MSDLEKEILEFGVGMFESFGLEELTAKLLTILYFSPSEVSMDELAKKTGYSLSSVSNKLKMLEDIWVQKSKKPGTKKIFYYMEKDLVSINQRKIKAAHERQIHQIKRFIPYIVEKYKNEKLTEGEKEIMKNAKNYYQQILRFESMLDEFEKYLEKQKQEETG
jgi:DNA-binding transcriptional regulator GbsR (MarR family)